MTGDPAIARLAAAQHGVVTRAQLLSGGMSGRAIDHRITSKRLHPVHRGVYLVGHALPLPLAKETAAVLACGERAVLSHESAATLWGLSAPSGGPIDITLPSRSNRSRPGIRLHFSRRLDPKDVRHHNGLPLTAPVRTIIDLAHVLPFRDLQRAYEGAQVQRLVRPSELRSALGRSPGRRGAPAIRALLDLDLKPAPTRSEAEARLLALLRAADLPPTDVNARIGRHEVDFLWRHQRLVVEVDGFAYHAHRAAFRA
jgi:Transcriptional regulator, AbiEi antitoxin